MSDRRTAWVLGLAGLAPFVLTLGLVWWGPISWQGMAVKAFMAYSAVILSFLGGTHWGAALQRAEPGQRRRLMIAMLPSLVAWPALLLPALWGLVILGLGFVFMWAYDLGRHGWPRWYWLLRSVLTAGVVLAHLALLTHLLR
ncbi:MAG: DUF3429 domain-containing protein [Pseudomonadota bacterium]